MEKEEIMAVYMLFLRYGPSAIIKCVEGICIAEAIEENSLALLEYVNALQKHKDAVFRMLREAGSASKEYEDLTVAYMVVERDVIKKNETGGPWKYRDLEGCG